MGWSGLVEPYKYTLSAVAWESSKLIRMDAKLLRKALDAHPEIGYKVTRSLSGIMSLRLTQITHALISEREVFFAGLKAPAARSEGLARYRHAGVPAPG